MISSRYGSHALALDARLGRGAGAESVDTSSLVAGFASPASVKIAGFPPPESVDTEAVEMAGFAGAESVDIPGGELAGFALDSLGRPRPRTGIPAAFK
jgi:hypothetical protein